jgi:hypothetical protein
MRRKVFSIIITGVLLSSLSFGYSGGSGTAEDPYQIADANDLLALAADTNDYSKYFILTADVNLQGQVFTTAIIAADTIPGYPFQGTAFTGTFDGDGHKITNLTINDNGAGNDYLGLFGYVSGEIKNLGLENFAVSGSIGSQYVGGLVGNNGGNISNCDSTGAITGEANSIDLGGLVGSNSGGISNCYSTGAVSGGDNSGSLGGLVGNNGGTISNCYSTGAVTGGNNSHELGGLVGENYSGTLTSCYATGSVSGYDVVGGLVGWNLGSTSNCYSTGVVSGSSGSYDVGGLAGRNQGNISNCYSTGVVSGDSCVGGLVGGNWGGSISQCYSTGAVSGPSGSWAVGGLVGNNTSYGSISNCYSTGAVSGSSYVGGLVGLNNYGGSISNCYSTGTVSGYQYVGGLVGNNGGTIYCYFLDTSGPDNGNGEPLDDIQMKQQASFVGWDFVGETANGTEDIWRMCIDGVNYPLLWWQFNNIADFTCPDGVNVEDLDYFVERWLESDCVSSNNFCGGADMDASGVVDFKDFAILASHWLEGN